MRNLFFTIAILLNFGTFSAFGENTEEKFDPNRNLNKFHHLATSNEFTLGAVTSIAQDKKGLMWFGTRQGIMIYDGSEFKRLEVLNEQLNQRDQTDISDLIIDQRGLLWLGTTNGLALINPKTMTFIPLVDSGSSSSYLREPVNCINELQSGSILIGSSSGLYEHAPEAQIVRSVSFEKNMRVLTASNPILSIYQSYDGIVWIGTENGLLKSQSAKLSDGFVSYHHLSSDPSSLLNNEVHALAEDKSGNILIGTRNGLDLLENKKPPFIHISESKYHLSHEFVRAITIDDSDRIWVGTYDGITVLEPSGGQQIIEHHSLKPNSLKDNKIRTFYKDSSGGIWVGTYYGGVNYWNTQNFNFGHLDDSGEARLSYNVVSALESDKKGNIIIGTEGRGLCIYNEAQNSIRYLEKLKDGSDVGSVKALLVNGDECWIGTYNNGLIKLNLIDQSFEQYRQKSMNKFTISNDRVISLALVGDNLICAGTIGGGLNVMNTITGEIKVFGIAEGLPGNSVRSMTTDEGQNLWIGTENGLCKLEASSLMDGRYEFTHFEVEGMQSTEMYSNQVFADHSGRIWLGTANSGLFKYENHKLIPQNKLPVKSVFSISEDIHGMLWISTDLGLVRFQPATGEMKVFNQNHGLKSNEFTKGAVLNSSSGIMYFGGASGLTYFNPESLDLTDALNPPIFLTHLKLNNYEVQPGDSSGILQNSLTYTDHIRLNHNQSNFTLQFAHPVFRRQRNFIYQYKLKGINEDWISTSVPIASYNIQRGGDYVFEVRAVDAETNNFSPVTTLHIKMLPAPWRTWWAFLFYGIIIMASLVALISVIQVQTRLKHNLELEKQAHEHEQEINEHKLQFFTNISHEFRTPLTLILGPLEQIIQDYRGSSKVFRSLKIIQKNADHLYRLISELMIFRKLEKKQIELKLRNSDIISYLYEIYLLFEPQAKIKNCTYTFDTSEKLIYVAIDKDKLERVFFNLLSNAFKYTEPGGKISVHISRERDQVNISVRDNGCGIAQEHIPYIFNRFYEVKQSADDKIYQQGTGIGLTIARNITELHKGSIKAESSNGKGSSFTVTLPILVKADQRELEEPEHFEPSLIPLVDRPHMDEFIAFSSPGSEVKEISSTKILIVEDDPAMRGFLVEVLSTRYQVDFKENGADAYNFALAYQPELIISDVMMPVMDGIEFCTKIKSSIETSHIPFIMLTARSSVIHKFDGLESGADEYLSKPFVVKELMLKCHNILTTRQNLKAVFEKSGELSLPKSSMSSMDEKLMKKSIEIVRENLSNEFFDIADFCEQLGVSRTVLFSKIKSWTQMTPNDFITSLRMKKAAELIERRVHEISQVAYQVGFKDPKYFSRCFRKKYGMSPKDYHTRFKV